MWNSSSYYTFYTCNTFRHASYILITNSELAFCRMDISFGAKTWGYVLLRVFCYTVIYSTLTNRSKQWGKPFLTLKPWLKELMVGLLPFSGHECSYYWITTAVMIQLWWNAWRIRRLQPACQVSSRKKQTFPQKLSCSNREFEKEN